MRRLARNTNTVGWETSGGPDPAGPRADDDLCLRLRGYLECRSRHVDPPAALAEAWDRFYDLYTPRIRALLARFALAEADREDCLQEVWAKLLARPAALPEAPRCARLWAWLITVTRNQAVDALRRRRRRAAEWGDDALDIVDDQPGPADALDRASTQAWVRIMLAELSERTSAISFRVLQLRAIEGRTNAEVADILGLSPEQVRFRMHRMTRKFRDLLERSVDLDLAE